VEARGKKGESRMQKYTQDRLITKHKNYKEFTAQDKKRKHTDAPKEQRNFTFHSSVKARNNDL